MMTMSPKQRNKNHEENEEMRHPTRHTRYSNTLEIAPTTNGSMSMKREIILHEQQHCGDLEQNGISRTFPTKRSRGKRSTTRAMRLFLSVCSVYCTSLWVLSLRQTFYEETDVRRRALEEFTTPKFPVSEVFVISMKESTFNVFQHRNFDLSMSAAGWDDDAVLAGENRPKMTVKWFEAYDGMNQTVLDDWATVTKLKRVNVSEFEAMDKNKRKEHYRSPHAVGCYLSHWRLLETAWKSWGNAKTELKSLPSSQNRLDIRRKKPDMMFVFEDDAHCVSNVVDKTWEVVQKLPKDWDILYIGGKPFSYYTMGKTLQEMVQTKVQTLVDPSKRPSNDELLRRMCQGEFGESMSGPFPPEGFNSTTESPPYWQSKNVLNTNAYVINPKRIRRVLRVLSKPMNDYKPIDVVLSEDMFREFTSPYECNENKNSTSAPLKVFLTPEMYCDQEVQRYIVDRDKSAPWEGYHHLPWREFQGFPDMKAYVWGPTARVDMCAKFETA